MSRCIHGFEKCGLCHTKDGNEWPNVGTPGHCDWSVKTTYGIRWTLSQVAQGMAIGAVAGVMFWGFVYIVWEIFSKLISQG